MKIIKIRCKKCNKINLKYLKIGKGRLWHCWKTRIIEDNTIKENGEIKCTCGNIIGIDKKSYIKIKQNNIKY